MDIIACRLKKGQDLLTEIEIVAKKNRLSAGVILSGVGSLKETTIRLPMINGKTKMINLINTEIILIHGTVSRKGCHLHMVVSDDKGRAYGGHLKKGNIVRTTCELVIAKTDALEFQRIKDLDTGFDELEIAPTS